MSPWFSDDAVPVDKQVLDWDFVREGLQKPTEDYDDGAKGFFIINNDRRYAATDDRPGFN